MIDSEHAFREMSSEQFADHVKTTVPYVGQEDRTIEMVPTEVLRGITPGNKLGKTDIDALSADLLSNGFNNPAILNYSVGDNTAIVAEGNHRIEAASRSGITEVPTRVIRQHGPVGGTPVKGFDTTPKEDGHYVHVPGDLRPSQIMEISHDQ